jgi:transposase
MARTASWYAVAVELWARIEPLLPARVNTHPFGGGRPRRSDRVCMDAIFFVLRTGCQWNALNATGICASSTAHDRFQEWVAAGVFWRMWCLALMEYDEVKGIDWRWVSADGAMTKAPLGGEKNRSEPHGSGQRRHQAQPADRGRRRADRLGRGRRQRQRLQVAARDD